MKAYKQPVLLTPLLWLWRHFVGKLLFGWFGPYKVEGAENVPKTGGILVLANHLSTADPPFTQLVCPRRIYFMANSEVWEWDEKGAHGTPPNFAHKVSKWLANFYGAFPVQTRSADRAAIKKAVELLKAGECVCIYPEGGTSPGGIQPLFSGPALIVRQAKTPIICLGVSGTEKIIPHESVQIRRAKHLVTAKWGQPRTFESESGQEIMDWVEDQLVMLSGLPKATGDMIAPNAPVRSN